MDSVRSTIVIFHDQWQLFLLLAVLLIGVTEAGFWVARQSERRDENARSQIATTEGALLGLLGLLLGSHFRHDSFSL